MTKTFRVGVFCGFSVLAACGGASPPDAQSAAATPPPTFEAQAAAGQKLYSEQCAGCHGDRGEGKKAPKLVGLKDGALPLDPPAGSKYRKVQFKTVADVAAYTVSSMPPNAPGSLSQEHYWDILAFDLKANGIDLGEQRLDAQSAATLTIPR